VEATLVNPGEPVRLLLSPKKRVRQDFSFPSSDKQEFVDLLKSLKKLVESPDSDTNSPDEEENEIIFSWDNPFLLHQIPGKAESNVFHIKGQGTVDYEESLSGDYSRFPGSMPDDSRANASPDEDPLYLPGIIDALKRSKKGLEGFQENRIVHLISQKDPESFSLRGAYSSSQEEVLYHSGRGFHPNSRTKATESSGSGIHTITQSKESGLYGDRFNTNGQIKSSDSHAYKVYYTFRENGGLKISRKESAEDKTPGLFPGREEMGGPKLDKNLRIFNEIMKNRNIDLAETKPGGHQVLSEKIEKMGGARKREVELGGRRAVISLHDEFPLLQENGIIEKVNIRQSEMTRQMAQIMTGFYRDRNCDRKTVELSFSPPRLGKVFITLRMEKGILRPDFVCRPQVAEHIRESLPELRTMLENNGVVLGESSINAGWDRSSGDARWYWGNSEEERDKGHKPQNSVREINYEVFAENSSRYNYLI